MAWAGAWFKDVEKVAGVLASGTKKRLRQNTLFLLIKYPMDLIERGE